MSQSRTGTAAIGAKRPFAGTVGSAKCDLHDSMRATGCAFRLADQCTASAASTSTMPITVKDVPSPGLDASRPCRGLRSPAGARWRGPRRRGPGNNRWSGAIRSNGSSGRLLNSLVKFRDSFRGCQSDGENQSPRQIVHASICTGRKSVDQTNAMRL
jgi:hypothetical protein